MTMPVLEGLRSRLVVSCQAYPGEPMRDVNVMTAVARAAAAGGAAAIRAQGIDDLAAVMEPGIAALLAAHARGVTPSAAALTLWHEFVRSRSALLELVEVSGPAMRRRA